MKSNGKDSSSTQKREHWLKHIREWETSKLSQESYCKQTGIQYGAFGYWRKQFLLESGSSKPRQFLPVKIKKSDETSADQPSTSIKIKLATGSVISIPTSLGMNEIATLIRMLETPHA